MDAFDRTDPHEIALRQQLEHITARVAARGILTYRAEAPLPAQRQMLLACVDQARAAGLSLPTFTINWVDAPRDEFSGSAHRDEAGRYSIRLSVNARPGDLREIMFHELQHLHDYRAGVTDAVELERRAMRFAARMVGR